MRFSALFIIRCHSSSNLLTTSSFSLGADKRLNLARSAISLVRKATAFAHTLNETAPSFAHLSRTSHNTFLRWSQATIHKALTGAVSGLALRKATTSVMRFRQLCRSAASACSKETFVPRENLQLASLSNFAKSACANFAIFGGTCPSPMLSCFSTSSLAPLPAAPLYTLTALRRITRTEFSSCSLSSSTSLNVVNGVLANFFQLRMLLEICESASKVYSWTTYLAAFVFETLPIALFSL